MAGSRDEMGEVLRRPDPNAPAYGVIGVGEKIANTSKAQLDTLMRLADMKMLHLLSQNEFQNEFPK